jgi:hypothetical protein
MPMGKITLFAAPKVDPAPAWSPTEDDLRGFGAKAMAELQHLREAVHQLDAGILEKAAVVASVFGMPELASMNADDACNELVELVKRSDVYDVLDAYQRSRCAAERKAG